MLSSDLGADFVSTYYMISPPIADFIEQHPSLKLATRFELLPSIVLSSSDLTIPLSGKISLLVFIIASTMLLVAFTTKIYHKK